jgi:hypothetical protein
MNLNPFDCGSTPNAPLAQDICQQIHCIALQRAVRDQHIDSLPNSVPLEQLCYRIRWLGSEGYLLHPSDIERIFQGVSLSMYQEIETLYVSRTERSIKMVGRIVQAMAKRAGVVPVDYEAIWAICAFLYDRRVLETQVTIEHTDTTWWVVQICLDIQIQNGNTDLYHPCIACVLDTQPPKVLAFRVARDMSDTASVSLALYDALVAQRRPAQIGAAGLSWSLPTRVVVIGAVYRDCQQACKVAGITTETAQNLPSNLQPLVSASQRDWVQMFTGDVLQAGRFELLFDSYLYRVHSYSPLRVREQQVSKFSHLVGYNRDPAWQFPALRWLLPAHLGIISSEGTAIYDGLHYTDDLLSYWPGHPVIIRRSEHAEVGAWIYLDGEVLCQAMARELRRRDGSYRSRRV